MADRASLLVEMSDSDSDMEELVHFVDTSTSQYNIAHSTLHKVLNNSGLEPAQFVSFTKAPLDGVGSNQTLNMLKMLASSPVIDFVVVTLSYQEILIRAVGLMTGNV